MRGEYRVSIASYPNAVCIVTLRADCPSFPPCHCAGFTSETSKRLLRKTAFEMTSTGYLSEWAEDHQLMEVPFCSRERILLLRMGRQLYCRIAVEQLHSRI
jgi:hypothetical protein